MLSPSSICDIYNAKISVYLNDAYRGLLGVRRCRVICDRLHIGFPAIIAKRALDTSQYRLRASKAGLLVNTCILALGGCKIELTT